MSLCLLPPGADHAKPPRARRTRQRRPGYARSHPLYPFAWHTPVLVVPGLNDSGPRHWQSLWQARHPALTRVVQSDFAAPSLAHWAETVARAVAAAPEPPIVVAHSFGCLATVRAVRHHGAAIAGALLVAPADPARFDIANEEVAGVLPAPATLVASTNDPWLKFVKAGALAAQWGCRFVSVGEAGHVNAESGFGDWPEGFALLRDVAERAAAAGTVHPRDRGAQHATA
jgi:hypothetical protein